WKPDAMVARLHLAGDDLDRTARLLDLLLGRSGEGRRLDRELLGQLALAEDLHRRPGARNHPGALQRGQVDDAGRKALLDGAHVDREDLLPERVLEALLGEAALHRHLPALEADPGAVMSGAGLLALDALARLLAGARARPAADALAVARRA